MSPKRPQAFAHPSRAANRKLKPYAKAQDSEGASGSRKKRISVKSLLNTGNDVSEEDLPLRAVAGNSMAGKESFDRAPALEHYDDPGTPNDLSGEPKDYPGMPTHEQFLKIVDDYLASLHDRKKDKALITQEMHEMIYDTLVNPESTRLGTPQFRFWARKMFKYVEVGGEMVITHEGRPVAVKEHMYDILCMCHRESQHAGRDKTCKVIREYYTWIPKELTANFVKACPTCAAGRPNMVRPSSGCSSTEKDDQVGYVKQDPERRSPSVSLAPAAGFFPVGSPNDAMYQARPTGLASGPVKTENNVHFDSNSFPAIDVPQGGFRSITSPHLYLPTSSRNDELTGGLTVPSDYAELPRISRPDTSDYAGGSGIAVPLPPLMQYLSGTSVSDGQPSPRQDMRSTVLHGNIHMSLPPLMKYLQDPAQTTTSMTHTMMLPPIQTSNSNAGSEVPIDPILLAGSDSPLPRNALSMNPITAANDSYPLRTPIPGVDAILSSIQLSLLPPTPLKHQNAPSTLPNVSDFDRETDLRAMPPTPQIIADGAHPAGGTGVGLGLERTWNYERAPGQRPYGSFSGASWSSGSSEAGTPISATFPPEVHIVGASGVGAGERGYYGRDGDERQGHGYRHEGNQTIYPQLGLTAAQEARGQGNPQKRFKVE